MLDESETATLKWLKQSLQNNSRNRQHDSEPQNQKVAIDIITNLVAWIYTES